MNNLKKHLNKYVIAFIVITGFHCAAATVAPLFIPLLGASPWKNPADSTNTFFFINIQDNTSKSTFDGNENLPSPSISQAHFTGAFDNHNIHFTYDADADASRAGKTYTGTINDASTVINLNGTDTNNPLPPLTLKK